jgi:hypothetical protein
MYALIQRTIEQTHQACKRTVEQTHQACKRTVEQFLHESMPSETSSSEDSESVPSESSSAEDGESVPSESSSSEDSEYVPSETASTLTEYSTETEEEEDDDFMTERSKQMCYSGEEIKKMNDFELVSNFVRIKGVTHLSCSHCKKPKPIVGTWVFAIRNRCERKGLSVNTPLPKTCDHMLLVDRVRNSVNNKIYPILRNSDVSAEDKQRAIDWKSKKFAEIGNKIRPSKYAESDN